MPIRPVFTFLALATVASTYEAQAQNELRYVGRSIPSASSSTTHDMPSFAAGVVAAFAGDDAIFYIDAEGTVRAAGNNASGRLGLGTYERFAYQAQPLSEQFAKVIPNGSGTFFLKENGDLYSTGQNRGGFLPPQTNAFLQPIKIHENVKTVAASGNSVATLLQTGELLLSAESQIHLFGNPPGSDPDENPDGLLPFDTDVADVLISYNALIVLQTDGTLTAQSHNAPDPEQDPFTPQVIAQNVTAISRLASNGFTYLNSDGSAYLWFGYNSLTLAESGVVSISGERFVKDDGTSWGPDWEASQEANQSPDPSAWSTLIVTEKEQRETITNGYGVTATLAENGDLSLSGSSSLIVGPKPLILSDAPRHLDVEAKDVSTSTEHALFQKPDGSVWGLGSNAFQELSSSTERSISSPVLLQEDAIAFDAATYSSFLVDADSKLWGYGNATRLTGSPTTSATPLQLDTGVTAVEGASGSVSYLKEDGSLWLLGANDPIRTNDDPFSDYNDPHQVAQNVSAIANTGTSLFWIDTDQNLWALGGFLNSINPENAATPYKIAESVSQLSAPDGASGTTFIKTNGELWTVGLSYFNNPNRGTPILIDTDVTQAAASDYADLYYTKSDNSIWYAGGREPYGSPDATAPVGLESKQVFDGEAFIDFDVTRYAVVYISPTVPSPAITVQPADTTVARGETATLSVSAHRGFPGYIWYRGEKGDRSHPIEQSGLPTLEVTPFSTETYWVEVYNSGGSIESETATVTVTDSLPSAYTDWIQFWNLNTFNRLPTDNPDKDPYSNYEEFLLGYSPHFKNASSIIGYDITREQFYLTWPLNPVNSDFQSFRTSPDLKTWTDIPATEIDIQETDGTKFWIHLPNTESSTSQFLQFLLDLD